MIRVLFSHPFGRFDTGFDIGFDSGFDVQSNVGLSVSLLGCLSDPAFHAERSPALLRTGGGL
jgi:hypothetical protein